MNIHTGLEKIDKLSDSQLKQLIRQCQIEIDNYYKCSVNDSEKDKIKYGIPYLNRLEKRKMLFENKLGQ